MRSPRIIVVGAGPAGMMAAIRAAQMGPPVTLLEKNASCGRKLSLTGRGRCNIANDRPVEDFFAVFGKNGAFLRDAAKSFYVAELLGFFEREGMKFSRERQGRIFPVSESAADVVRILEKVLKREGVSLVLSAVVDDVSIRKDRVAGVRLEKGSTLDAERVVIASGGVSYPQTGSTGDGLRIAGKLGHHIETVRGGLVPLETAEGFVPDLQGLTLKNVALTFHAGRRRLACGVGEVLFTHFGVSGPLVLDASGWVTEALERQDAVTASIDLKPGMSAEALEKRLLRDFEARGALKVKNYLQDLAPVRLADALITLISLDPDKKCHQVTHAQRQAIVNGFKELRVTIKRARPVSEAMVTCGGVSLKDVDPRTMASKRIPGLYFCGEVLDLAAPSGGFNLQAAFSTGYLAGEAAAKSLAAEGKDA